MTKFRKILSFIFLFTIFNVQADTLSKIKSTGIVNIGVRINADPFSYYENGQSHGYMVELCNNVVEEIQKEIGKKNFYTLYSSNT